jgi:PAS domain S-box-containing protein/putative nucleotidyltransferase with HDIG domain
MPKGIDESLTNLKFVEGTLTFADIIDTISDAVIIVDTHGAIIRENLQAEVLFKYSPAELVGKLIEQLVPLNLRGIHTKYRENFINNPKRRPMGTILSLEAVDKYQKLIPVDISLNPLIHDGQIYIMLFIRDMSLIVNAYEETLVGWSRAMDFRDKETENHTQRVTLLTLKMCRALNLTQTQITHARRGALLHDIGKMAVPDEILRKPGKLTDEEWVIMKKHPEYAYEMLYPIEFLRPALDIPYCHHEKWDGTGYPRRLKGEVIPIAARIFAVVDVWDALCSDRPYRKAMSTDQVCAYIRSESGTHFDPKVVDVFLDMICNFSKEEVISQLEQVKM